MIGLDLLACHLTGDFIFQTGHMAQYKLTDWRVRLLHVAVYTAPFVAWAALSGYGLWVVLLFGSLLALSHFVIDSRRWVGDEWPPRPIIIDQCLHVIALAVVARVLG